MDIKNHTYCFFNDIVNIKNFDPINIKRDENSHKSFFIYYIGHVTIKDLKDVKVNRVNFNTLFSAKWMDILRN